MKTRVQTNVVVNLIRTITMTILSFVTFPFVCRILGDSALGMYSWATAFVYYFLILARISIPNIAVRECTKVKDEPEKLSMKAQEFFILQAITTLLSFTLMCGIIFLVPSLKENSTLIFIVSINFLAGVLSFEWIFTALEKHTYLAIRSIVIATVIDILIFAFIRQPEHVYLYAFLCIATTLLTVASNLIYLPSLLKYKKTGPYNFKQYIPLLGTLFLISLAVALYDKTDSFILGFIDPSKASVGTYSVGMKGVEIVIGLITSLSTVFIPRATYYYANKDERQYRNLNKYAMNLCLFITVPAAALMIGLSTPITGLISGNYVSGGYADVNYVLISLASLTITFSASSIIYTQILIPQKREKTYLIVIFSGAAINLGLSLLFALVFFKERPAMGVAIATSITDLGIISALTALTWKDSKSILFNINNLKILLFGIAIGVASYFLSPLLRNVFIYDLGIEMAYLLEIFITFLTCAIVYVAGLFLIKEKLLNSIRHK